MFYTTQQRNQLQNEHAKITTKKKQQQQQKFNVSFQKKKITRNIVHAHDKFP